VISAALGAVVAAVAGLILSMSPIIAILVGTAAGLTLPHYALKRAIAARKRRFVELLPDAIDLMVRSMKSGLSVTEAINAVGDNIADPLGEAFRQVTDCVRLGETMDEALWDVARRVNLPDFNFLVVSLSVQRETGGNLAESLSNLSDILRRRRQVKAKVKALSSEARASTKIIGSLPIFVMAMLYFVSTDYVMKLFTDPRGMILVGIGLGGMVLGMLVMMKMSRFEI
jgi:tight adherence protein B